MGCHPSQVNASLFCVLAKFVLAVSVNISDGAPADVVTRSFQYKFDGLAQDCSNSSALALELLQSCTKPSI